MRKSLSGILLVGVILMALLGGVAALPHAHGDDFTHSKHASCPFYQISLHLIAPAALAAAILFGALFFGLLHPVSFFALPAVSAIYQHLRSPPPHSR